MEHKVTTERVTLRKDAIGVVGIIFFVIAANGPLTVLLGGTPAGISFGNGVGFPGAFLLVALVYLVFSVGFAAMARHIKNAGAFYAYVSNGLGHPVGVGAAFTSIAAYSALNLALYGIFGFFGGLLFTNITGIELPWWVVCAFFVIVVHFFSIKNIEFNGRMLGILMVAEVLIILIFDGGVAMTGGPEGFTLAPFAVDHVFTAGLGGAIVFCISCFIGFETAAIYSEEAKDPKTTVPRALYISVVLIAGFAAVSTWLMMVAYGPDKAVEVAGQDPGNLWFNIAANVLGTWSVDVMNVLMTTSLFAAILCLTNILSRYLFCLGREKVIWSALARLHPVQQTPVAASTFQTVIMLIAIVSAGLFGLDPLNVLMPLASALCSVAIVSVQCLTALAVIGFFRSDSRGTNAWQRLIAPLLSFIALTTILVLMLQNIDVLTGGRALFNWLIPTFVLTIALGGFMYAVWLRENRPAVYANLTRFLTEAEA